MQTVKFIHLEPINFLKSDQLGAACGKVFGAPPRSLPQDSGTHSASWHSGVTPQDSFV